MRRRAGAPAAWTWLRQAPSSAGTQNVRPEESLRAKRGNPDRLQVTQNASSADYLASNKTAEVFDLDGNYHWLHEDEYALLAALIEDGEVELGLRPSTAEND